jgi:hypothetical protein
MGILAVSVTYMLKLKKRKVTTRLEISITRSRLKPHGKIENFLPKSRHRPHVMPLHLLQFRLSPTGTVRKLSLARLFQITNQKI